MNDITQSQGESTPLPPLICSAFDDLLEREWNRGDFPSGLKRPLMEAMRATAGWVMDRIEDGGEANMLRTGKLEGMHYQALKSLRTDDDAAEHAMTKPAIGKSRSITEGPVPPRLARTISDLFARFGFPDEVKADLRGKTAYEIATQPDASKKQRVFGDAMYRHEDLDTRTLGAYLDEAAP